MSLPAQFPGLPGFGTTYQVVHRIIFKQGDWTSNLAQGKIISGAASRDPGNTDATDVLRCGLLMGKITASGLYAPAFVGATTVAYSSGGTTLTVSAAAATEIVRLVGTSGTAELVAIGPPSAAGTVAVTDVDHSAVNTTTGAITITDLGVDKIAGTLIAVKDGRQFPKAPIAKSDGIQVTDIMRTTSINVPFPKLPIAGVIDTDFVLPVWPSDTSLQAWIASKMLNEGLGGKWVFDSNF